MKKALVIILSVLMLMGTFPETYDYVFFKLNQVYIAQTQCVQKDIKANTCQGKCYLKKLMSEDQNHDKPYSPTERESKNSSQYCIEIEEISFPQPILNVKKQSIFTTKFLIDRLASKKLLRPPDYSFL